MIPKCWQNGDISRNYEGHDVFKKNTHLDMESYTKFLKKIHLRLKLQSHLLVWGIITNQKNKKRRKTFIMGMELLWTNKRERTGNYGLGGKYYYFTNFTLKDLLQNTFCTCIILCNNIYKGRRNVTPQKMMKWMGDGRGYIYHAFRSDTGLVIRRNKHFNFILLLCWSQSKNSSQYLHPN